MVDHRISTGLICYAHLFFVIKQLATKHYGVQRKWKKKKEKKKKARKVNRHICYLHYQVVVWNYKCICSNTFHRIIREHSGKEIEQTIKNSIIFALLAFDCLVWAS